jgi:putative ABC transport system permease protein
MLLIGAGLLLRSFVNLLNTDQGYRSENRLTGRLTLSARYDKEATRIQLYDRILSNLAVAPEVKAAALTSVLPLTTRNLTGWLRVEGRSLEEAQRKLPVFTASISPAYFNVMGIGLRAGRGFDESDRQGAPSVAIISESLARNLFADENPLGQRLAIPSASAEWSTIVGVVGDVRHKGMERALEPMAYLSFRQASPVRMTLVVSGDLEAARLAPVLRAAVQAVDPALPVHEVMTMDARLSQSAAARRFNLTLLGALATVALVLASVGIYGVIAYVVTQRTREIGIRMALGAQARDVLRMILRQGMTLALTGLLLGIGGALAMTRWLQAWLYGVSVTDPLTFVGITCLLAFVAFVACWLPARRATKVDPMIALRRE